MRVVLLFTIISAFCSDVYVFWLCLHTFMQTITLLRDVCFVRITNKGCRNNILSAYVTYII